MIKKYPQFSFGFAIIFGFELIAEGNNLKWLIYLTKPLITILLISFIIKTIKHQGRFSRKVIAGLIFSLFGDTLLMFVSYSDLYFMLGLVAFLFAHFAYISAFYIDYLKKENINRSYIWSTIMLFSIYSLGFYFYLRPHLGEMQIPVLIYALTISVMAIMAVSRINKVNTTSFKLIFIGAILFVLSDSFLAYFKFVNHFSYSYLLIMPTYMLAQYYIAMGTVERKYLKKEAV